MKKYIFIAFLMLLNQTIIAQTALEAFQNSENDLSGSARVQGMSGAFGALGGDISAININPAASAVTSKSELTFSLDYTNKLNDLSFNENKTNTSSNNFGVNQLGGVFVFKSDNENAVSKFSFGINYNRENTYKNYHFIKGENSNSIDNYFLDYANGIEFGDLWLMDGEYLEDAYLDIGSAFGFATQQAFLGYWSGVIDPLIDDEFNTDYISTATYSNVNQQFQRETKGYKSLVNFNFATQHKDNLYFGLNLNSHALEKEELTFLQEDGYDVDSANEYVDFENLNKLIGKGFSFHLGLIGKVNDNLRLGASYKSPVWYRMESTLSQQIYSSLEDQDIQYINHDIVGVFPNYKLQLPSELSGSLAYVFGQKGLISFDYVRKNYNDLKLKPESSVDHLYENNLLRNNLKATNTFKTGAEIRLNELSLRGGFQHNQSPLINSEFDADFNVYSLGFGYNFGKVKLDFALSKSDRENNHQMYNVGLTDNYSVNQNKTNGVLSLTFGL